jgi:hypothetical protein
VYLTGSSTFTISNGKIALNSAELGGGVYADNSGLAMSGGEIPGNTVTGKGGGVFVTGGNFTMSGGKITGNSSTPSTNSYGGSQNGGGVYLTGSAFTLKGGEISNNTCPHMGGGVYADNSELARTGGEITGNSASAWGDYQGGGGVAIAASSAFTMSGGKISGNSVPYSSDGGGGGGVLLTGSSAFTLNGGEISGNSIAQEYSNYGGVLLQYGSANTFTMNAGTISNHKSTGVGVNGAASQFTMNGGTISNNGAGVILDGKITFILNGGVITENGTGMHVSGPFYQGSLIFTIKKGTISKNGDLGINGGGGHVTMTMEDGEIWGNAGGGVEFECDGLFRMKGGKIRNNGTDHGTYWMPTGGVQVDVGSFFMEGGEIYQNISTHGGGVMTQLWGNFMMTGGEIWGNTSTQDGGGVYLGVEPDAPSYFIKTGGVIYGSNAPGGKQNTAAVKGHALAFFRDELRKKNQDLTLGANVQLTAFSDGEDNGMSSISLSGF